jgi:hypothetical protein
MRVIISQQSRMLFDAVKNCKLITKTNVDHTKIQELLTRIIHNDAAKYQENIADSFHDAIAASPTWGKLPKAYQQMTQTGKDADMGALVASSFIANMIKVGMTQPQVDRIIERALDAIAPLISGTLDDDMPGMSSRDISDRLASASLFSEGKAREIMDTLGKMWGDFQDSRYATDSVNNVESPTLEYGNEINRLVADEYLKDQQLFYLEYAEERLLQYGTEPDKEKAMGPVIILLEESAAMQEVLDSGEQKYVWGKSFALMVTKLAKEQNRPVKLIGFSTGVESSIDYALDINTCSSQELASAMNWVPNTKSTNWIGAFIPITKMFDGKYESADLLFITSGDYTITAVSADLDRKKSNRKFVDHFKDWKQQKNVRVSGILIGDETTRTVFIGGRDKSGKVRRIEGANDYCIDNVRAIADDVVCINDIADTSRLFGRLSSL